jgi:hypothetical protein
VKGSWRLPSLGFALTPQPCPQLAFWRFLTARWHHRIPRPSTLHVFPCPAKVYEKFAARRGIMGKIIGALAFWAIAWLIIRSLHPA